MNEQQNKTGWDELAIQALKDALVDGGYGEGWEHYHSGGGINGIQLEVKDQWLGDENTRYYFVGCVDYPSFGMDATTEDGHLTSHTFGEIWKDFTSPESLAKNVWEHIERIEKDYEADVAKQHGIEPEPIPGRCNKRGNSTRGCPTRRVNGKCAEHGGSFPPAVKPAMKLGHLIDVLYSYKIAAIESGLTSEQANKTGVFITDPNGHGIDSTANTIELVGAWLAERAELTTDIEVAASNETGFHLNIVLGRGAAWNLDL